MNEHILQFFEYGHLPQVLAQISAPFKTLAETIVMNVPNNTERAISLRKLLEGKDAAVRAMIAKETP